MWHQEVSKFAGQKVRLFCKLIFPGFVQAAAKYATDNEPLFGQVRSLENENYRQVLMRGLGWIGNKLRKRKKYRRKGIVN